MPTRTRTEQPNAPPDPHQRHERPQPAPELQNNRNKPYKKRANINIATLNINGATAPASNMNLIEKWSMINRTLRSERIAILALQETHLDEERATEIQKCFQKSFELHYSSDPVNPRTTAGVAFIINKALIVPDQITVRTLIPGRAAVLSIAWSATPKINILNIYAPVERQLQPEFWSRIDRRRVRARFPRPDFVLGDFNVTEDPIDRSPPHQDDRAATNALRETKQKWEIQDHWRHSHPNERQFTYRAQREGNWIQSRLDRIYAARRHAPNMFEWKAGPTATPTDHWLVAVKYAPKDAPSIGEGRWTWPLQSLTDPNLIEKVAKRGQTTQEDLDRLDRGETRRNETNPQKLWEEFKKDIQNIAKEHTHKSRHKTASMIKRLEKDIKTITADPDFDANEKMRAEEAFLENKLAHLIKTMARNQKAEFKAELAIHGERLGGIWSAINKEKKPRNLISRLKIPESNPPQHERESVRMAELARKYHDSLQQQDILNQSENEREAEIERALSTIPPTRQLEDPQATEMNKAVTSAQVRLSITHAKNKTATGMDGCPYELWKALEHLHQEKSNEGKPSFDITQTLTRVFQDIQSHGLEENSSFALGWMSPIYKKKDRAEISNYRPITLLNTDYKLLTKVLALQLIDSIEHMIHPDQTGFIPKRSIFDNIRLAKTIIKYAELADEDGAIVALDQEKAYDKIRHDYLWATLERFRVPAAFTNTVKALYGNAHTRVAINGALSRPYKVTRGVRQGDPLSCALFDLAIEPLACKLREDQALEGITIPGVEDKIIVSMFADDTNLFLGKNDRMDYVQTILNEWCRASGAKYNIEKTEIIPIGSKEHRTRVNTTRKINQLDRTPLDDRIKIAQDGDAVRSLGAWIGNETNLKTPWEPILDNIHKTLKRWGKSNPTLTGRKLITQAVIGGHTQFLAKAQGMPPDVEKALTKMAREFIWEGCAATGIALENLHSPIEEGGLNLINIEMRNDAIEIIWIKAYLDFSPSRPTWAKITDLIIDASMPQGPNAQARINCFLQTWTPPQRGGRTSKIDEDTARMLRAAKKYNVNFAAIRLDTRLKAQLPAWFHVGSENRPINNNTSKCLLTKHGTKTIADLLKTSARLRNQTPENPHRPSNFCRCKDCCDDRNTHCWTPHECAQEALTRIRTTFPILNPLAHDEHHGNFSLTPNRKRRNSNARERNEDILFDPSITTKNSLAECFRVFTDPGRTLRNPAKRTIIAGTNQRHEMVEVYTDGACFNNGKLNAKCGAGIWFGDNDPRNRAISIPGRNQSNQIGELTATIFAIQTIPNFVPLKIKTDSTYVINGLTKYLLTWENQGWINIKNAQLFKKAAYLLRRRTATTHLKWVKGHNGELGNEESDALAKEGAQKPTPDDLDLSIPNEFDVQGAKLSALTQAITYRGIMNRKRPNEREAATRNLQRTRQAVQDYNNTQETDETIWLSLTKKVLRTRVKQFLYKTMHNTYMVGSAWNRIQNAEHRGICAVCHVEDSMEHILIQCNSLPRRKVWELAQQTWPHAPELWPNITLGIILGIGCLSLPQQHAPGPNTRLPTPKERATLRLLQIILSEAAHLVWVLRCERVIHETEINENGIKKRWHRVINERLTTDRIAAQKTKRDKNLTKLAELTWKKLLKQYGTLPVNWFQNREVLVGSRSRPLGN
jgi:ribonuclease HI/exonuclease III